MRGEGKELKTTGRETNQKQADLANETLAELLFRIWKDHGSGRLEIRAAGRKHLIGFSGGNIRLAGADLDPERFLQRLEENQIFSSKVSRNCREALKTPDAELLPTLHDVGGLSPETLWRFLESSHRENLYPLFDLNSGGIGFQKDNEIHEGGVLFTLPTPEYILQGIRRMRNHALIAARMPEEEAVLETRTPEYAELLPLNPAEIYLFHLLKKARILSRVYPISQLGQRETRRGVYLFRSLEILSTEGKTGAGGRVPEFSHADLHHMLETFNLKLASIFKYLTKEIGPAAPNMLEKCVEDTRGLLSPFCRNLRIDQEGQVEPSSILKAGPSLSGRETRQAIIHDINEILASEILTVKKFLGNEHEAALIRLIARIEE